MEAYGGGGGEIALKGDGWFLNLKRLPLFASVASKLSTENTKLCTK